MPIAIDKILDCVLQLLQRRQFNLGRFDNLPLRKLRY
jgi:hypothetical protein